MKVYRMSNHSTRPDVCTRVLVVWLGISSGGPWEGPKAAMSLEDYTQEDLLWKNI